MSKASAQQAERAEAIRELKKLVKPGTEVCCVLRHVSASGMTRLIDFFVVRKGEMRCISGYIARILDYKRHLRKDGLKVEGCGMDMGLSVVYDLGRSLWPKGTRKSHGRRNGEPDHEGGYALKCRWI